jgi:hypothetical protein
VTPASAAAPTASRRNAGEVVADLYTKDGRPLKRSGDNLYSRSGTHVARVRGKKAFGPDGRYVGTIVGSRLIYRSTDSAAVSSGFAAGARGGSGSANAAGSAAWGEEPPIPD